MDVPGIIGIILSILGLGVVGFGYGFARLKKRTLDAVFSAIGQKKDEGGSERRIFKSYIQHSIKNEKTPVYSARDNKFNTALSAKELAKSLTASSQGQKKSEDNMVVFAESGFGKTMLMHYLVYFTARREFLRLVGKKDNNTDKLNAVGISYIWLRGVNSIDELKGKIGEAQYIFLDGLDESPLLNTAMLIATFAKGAKEKENAAIEEAGTEEKEAKAFPGFLQKEVSTSGMGDFAEYFNTAKKRDENNSTSTEEVFLNFLLCRIKASGSGAEKIIITSRTLGIPISDWKKTLSQIEENGGSKKNWSTGVYSIEGFTDEQCLQLAKKVTAKRKKERKQLLEQLQKELSLRGGGSIFRIPFFMRHIDALMKEALKRGGEIEREEAESIILNDILDREADKITEARRDDMLIKKTVKELLLRYILAIGRYMFNACYGVNQICVSKDELKAFSDGFRASLDADLQELYDSVYENILQSRCLLIPVNDEGDTKYSFVHKIIYENVVARAFAREGTFQERSTLLFGDGKNIKVVVYAALNEEETQEENVISYRGKIGANTAMLERWRRLFALYTFKEDKHKGLEKYIVGYEDKRRNKYKVNGAELSKETLFKLLSAEMVTLAKDIDSVDAVVERFPLKNVCIEEVGIDGNNINVYALNGMKIQNKDVCFPTRAENALAAIDVIEYMLNKEVDFSDRNLKDDSVLELLKYLPNAETLDISENAIRHFKHLSACENIKKLFIERNCFDDFDALSSALQELKNIEELRFSYSCVMRSATEFMRTFLGKINLIIYVSTNWEISGKKSTPHYFNLADWKIIGEKKSTPYSMPSIIDELFNLAYDYDWHKIKIIPNGGVNLIKNGYDYDWHKIKIIPNGGSNLIKNGVVFSSDYKTLIYCPDSAVSSGTYQIPPHVTTIGIGAFGGCKSLTHIVIPDNVTSIELYAFDGCDNLKTFTVNTASFEHGSSVRCKALTEFLVTNLASPYTSIDGALYRKDTADSTKIKSIVRYPVGKSEETYKIPDVIDSCLNGKFMQVESGAFDWCYALKKLIMSKTPITANLFNPNRHACGTGFTDIEVIPPAATKESEGLPQSNSISIDGVLFERDKENNPYKIICYLAGRVAPSYTIPAAVNIIGDSAFEGCSNLTEIKIPDGVTSIGDSAFKGCSNLTEIKISDGVTSIGDSAFKGCSSLKEIKIPDCITSIGDSAFEGCSSLTEINIPNSVASIGAGAFEGCSNLTEIKIPDGVTSIGDSAFKGCSSLKEIKIPDCITSIGESAFKGCRSLTEIKISDGVDSIKGFTFYKCSNLTEIKISDSVTKIENAAFWDCSRLEKLIIPKSVEKMGRQVFGGCSNLTIYCRAEEKPDGWDAKWNLDNRPVMWGYGGKNS
ncbi:MAG: leucine-rich repeat protein [Clostridiaceae bacterium]|jgi:hypothetical protein|nr:leucine-rich repeat protein [Clostridiaceae bacterium]